MSTYKVKICLLGDSYIGKTSFCTRLKYDLFEYISINTVGVDFMSKDFDVITSKESIKILWYLYDTAGQELYQSIVQSYYRDATVFLLGFDLTDIKSFKNLEKWLKEISHYNHSYYKIYLFGNKLDLTDKIKVSVNMVKELIEKYKIDYFEISVKNNNGIKNMLRHINQDLGEYIIETDNDILEENNIKLLNHKKINLKPVNYDYKCC